MSVNNFRYSLRHLRNGIAAALMLLALVSGFSSTASAHVLKSDNGIVAVLHVPPYDAPVANQSQELQFQFGTTTGSFQLHDYKVTVAIIDGGHTVEQEAVEPAYLGANANGNATVKFPEPAVYTVKLTGVSATGAPNFSMQYQVRVTGTAKVKSANKIQTIILGAAGAIIVIMLATRQILTGRKDAATHSKRPSRDSKRRSKQ